MPRRATVAVAVLLLGPSPATQEDAALENRVKVALEQARHALEYHLRRQDGGALALVCLAAAQDGLGMEDGSFRRAAHELVRTAMSDTYGLSLRLMVAAHVPDLPDREQTARRDTARLLEHQTTDGGFGYHASPARWDLSNSQYAALGLRAAAYLGQEVPAETWRKLLRRTLDHQGKDGGFGYSDRSPATVSMTVAGIAVIEICRRHLEMEERPEAESERSITAGWEWLERRRTQMFDLAPWHALYAFYGLERAAVLSGVETVGDVDWYATGAEILLPLQQRRGGFANPRHRSSGDRPSPVGDAIDTSFAVLFLRRSFQADLGAPAPGPITPGPSRGCRELEADANDRDVRAAIAYEVARGRTAVPDLLVAMRRGHEPARRAAALALMRISGDDFGYHPSRSAEENAEALRRAERWWLANRDR